MPQKSKKSDKKISGEVVSGGGKTFEKNKTKKVLSAEQPPDSENSESIESTESSKETGRVKSLLPVSKYKRVVKQKTTATGKQTTKPGRVKRKDVPEKRKRKYDIFGHEILDADEDETKAILYNKIGSEKENANLAEAYREGVESRVSGSIAIGDEGTDVLKQDEERGRGLKQETKNRVKESSHTTTAQKKKNYPTVAESLANETAVARLLAFGLSNASICTRLNLPIQTVEKIVSKIITIQRMEHSRTLEGMRYDMDNQITILLAEVLDGIDASKAERIRETITVDGDGNKKIQRQIVKGKVPADLINTARALLERRAKLFGLDSAPDAGRVIEERNAGIKTVIDAVAGVVTDKDQLTEIIKRIENAGESL